MRRVELRGKEKVQRAVNKLLMHNPFYSVILLKSKLSYSDQIPTMATDGLNILVNTEFTNTLTHEEIQGVLVHELLHVIYMHSIRRKDRHHKKFNVACDYAINPIVKESGFTLPDKHLDDGQYHGKSAEQIYEMLDDDEEGKPNDIGEDIQSPNMTKQEQKQLENDVKVAVAQAVHQAGKHVPSAIRKEVEDMLTDKVNWKDKLRDFMQQSLQGEDSSWHRPNRRFIGEDMYLPITVGEEVPNIAVLLDTSGSIYYNQDLFNEFTSELNNLIQDLSPEQVDIFYVDTKVRKHDTYDQGEKPEYDLVGGGGTDFISAWEKMEAVSPVCILAFTDLYARVPEFSNTPTLWLCYNNDSPTAPFGETTIIK